jgi:hypothetical protein
MRMRVRTSCAVLLASLGWVCSSEAGSGEGASEVCLDDCHWNDIYGSDGICDDGGPGAEWASCELGHDCTDCGGRSYAPPSTPDNCIDATLGNFTSDGECDDGGPGAEWRICSYGSDCSDCGTRYTMPPPMLPPADLCSNACTRTVSSTGEDVLHNFTHDGDCDDGGPGAEWATCELGLDCEDCGARHTAPPPPSERCEMNATQLSFSWALGALWLLLLASWLLMLLRACTRARCGRSSAFNPGGSTAVRTHRPRLVVLGLLLTIVPCLHLLYCGWGVWSFTFCVCLHCSFYTWGDYVAWRAVLCML